jgi:CBS domain-containing protein
MRIDEVMSHDVALVPPEASVEEAAQLMAELDAGALPVGSGRDVIAGIVTDRDILLRLVARGRSPAETLVSEVMSSDLLPCRPEDTVEDIARTMGMRQIRRMPVTDDDGRLVGMVTLADIERLERGHRP